MSQKNSRASLVESWLEDLGVDSLCEWDVLVFFFCHAVSLVSTEDVARLLGYPDTVVVAAADSLESKGLLQRSRVSQSVRLYQLTAQQDSPRGRAFTQLIDEMNNRAGRILLTKKLLQLAERRAKKTSGDGEETARENKEIKYG